MQPLAGATDGAAPYAYDGTDVNGNFFFDISAFFIDIVHMQRADLTA